MMNLNKLGDRIRLFRVKKKLTQENMANDLDISITAYSKIERGLTNVSISRLEHIAAVLDVSIMDLMEFEASNKHYSIPGSELPMAGDSVRSYGDYDTITLIQRLQEKDQEITRLRKIIVDKEEIISLLKEKIKE